MSHPADVLGFRELLDYTDEETTRWEGWMREQGEAVLAVPLGEGRWSTVGELAFHIFLVEQRYADRLLDEPPTPYENVPHASFDELFALHRRARGSLERFVCEASEEDWRRVLTFDTILSGGITASKRKIAAHALLHGVRHWAQIATALRQAGFAGQWPHDLLTSSALG
jgi:uncharacterized damage-inducible protein DinB